MELATYEQFAISNATIEDIVPWLTDGMSLNAVYWNGAVAGITLPQYVEAEIDMAAGGAKSDTASGKNLKDASLTNGLTIRVPLFVDSGERIIVDPRTLTFIRRASK
jgi:elongation factor P